MFCFVFSQAYVPIALEGAQFGALENEGKPKEQAHARNAPKNAEKSAKAVQNSGRLNTEDLSVFDSDEKVVDLLESPWVKRYNKLGEGDATGIAGSMFWVGVKVSISNSMESFEKVA